MSTPNSQENFPNVLAGSVPVRILDTQLIEDEFGRSRVLILDESMRGKDVLATLRYYQPREAEFRGQVTSLFNVFVAKKMSSMVIICDSPESRAEQDRSDQSLIRLSELNDIEDIDAEFAKIYDGDIDAIFRKKRGILLSIIDTGAMTGVPIMFYDDNELEHIPDQLIMEELSWLNRSAE